MQFKRIYTHCCDIIEKFPFYSIYLFGWGVALNYCGSNYFIFCFFGSVNF